jgi:hypothetical protein
MADQPDLRVSEVYIVTDPGNPDWDVLVAMTIPESQRVWDAGYKAELFAQPARSSDVQTFAAFAAEWLDE